MGEVHIWIVWTCWGKGIERRRQEIGIMKFTYLGSQSVRWDCNYISVIEFCYLHNFSQFICLIFFDNYCKILLQSQYYLFPNWLPFPSQRLESMGLLELRPKFLLPVPWSKFSVASWFPDKFYASLKRNQIGLVILLEYNRRTKLNTKC